MPQGFSFIIVIYSEEQQVCQWWAPVSQSITLITFALFEGPTKLLTWNDRF